jgi:DNA mismatch endonuclease (patch repair protein)
MEDQFRAGQRERWVSKLSRNMERDREVTDRLNGEGWTVLRIWESEVREELDEVVDRIVHDWR